MNLFEALRIALLDLALHKFRSGLATFGIILGVASVAAMISISEGAKRDALARIAVLGVDNVIARSVKPAGKDVDTSKKREWQIEYGLMRRDLEHVRSEFPSIRYAVGVRNMRMKLYAPNGKELDVSIVATEPDYLRVTRSGVKRGRFIADLDQQGHGMICVLGADAARKVFSYKDPLGEFVRIGTDWYRVVGIMEATGGLAAAGGDDVNNFIFIPLGTAQARYGDASFSRGAGTSEAVKIQLDEMMIQVADRDMVVPVSERLEAYLTRTHKLSDFKLLVPQELIRQDMATRRTWTIVMVVFAGISLVVGGTGIMNIMLANVTDRRKEVGTRRALGARRIDILRQFLFEAATLTTLGGLAGVGLGFVASREVTHYAKWPTIMTPGSIIVSLGVSCVTGLVFGLWPAWQAAKVSPIEALRSE